LLSDRAASNSAGKLLKAIPKNLDAVLQRQIGFLEVMRTLLHELRYAIRQLRKSPGFTLVAIITLALGIGANIAVFSVTNAVLLNPSGIPHPNGLIALRVRYRAMADLSNIGVSAPDFGDAADGKNFFASAALMQSAHFNLQGENSSPELLHGAQVSADYFNVFEARPYLGRVFTPEEEIPGADHEAVLSYRSWEKHFGSDPNIVGRTVMLSQQAYRIVGVMGPQFNWPNDVELWTPLALPPGQYHDPKYRYDEGYFGVARLRPGVSLNEVNSYLDHKAQENISAEGSKSFGRVSGWGMFGLPLTEITGGSLRKPLTLLLVAVGIVLLIACANIAGLQMARASARQRELAVKMALGASRGNLIRPALIESVVLTAAGVGLGFMVAAITAPLLVRGLPSILGSQIHASFLEPVLLLVTAIAVLISILCGVVPAWNRSQPGWFSALQEGGRTGMTGAASHTARSTLVIGQVALSLLLLAGAGLLLSSLRALERVETGFDPFGLLSAKLSLPESVYNKDEKQAAFYSALESRIAAIPGVQSAAVADALPFSGDGGTSSFFIQGRPAGPNDPGPHGNGRLISPSYFATLRIPLLVGRDFTADDRAGTDHVAIIDTTLAHQYWPGKNPIGERITNDDRVKGPWYTIVGVVAHARASSLESDTSEGFFYAPIAQIPTTSASLVVRSPRSASDLAQDVAVAVRSVDSNLPIYDVRTMEQMVNESLIGRRFVVLLLTTFAGLALLLAALGLYGVISYSVRLRTRELGVRMALGAQRTQVLRMVLLQGMRLAGIGMICGAVAAIAVGRIFASLLFRVGILEALPWIGAICLLLAVVLLATFLPARRAASIEPMQALRTE
jgi:predicted permease